MRLNILSSKSGGFCCCQNLHDFISHTILQLDESPRCKILFFFSENEITINWKLKKMQLSLPKCRSWCYNQTEPLKKNLNFFFCNLPVEVHDLHRRFSSAKLTARIFQGMPAADIDLPKKGVR